MIGIIHGRWCCLPLAFAFYLRRATLALRSVRIRGRALTFETKFTQAVRLIQSFAGVFPRAPILVVIDSWFRNNGFLKPLRRALGSRAHLLSRLRVNAVLHGLPVAVPGRAGRPRKYGERLGSVKAMQVALRATARTYSLNLFGRVCDVVAAEQVVMLKTLRCQVRVVWVYRRTQWIALVTTDLTLSVSQVIEIYGARWRIEAGFREIKQEIGSAQTQTRNPDAVTNHLHFCMVATTITWIYAASLEQARARRYAAARRTEYAFADLRRSRPRHPKFPHRYSHGAGRLRKTRNFSEENAGAKSCGHSRSPPARYRRLNRSSPSLPGTAAKPACSPCGNCPATKSWHVRSCGPRTGIRQSCRGRTMPKRSSPPAPRSRRDSPSAPG
ncbi:IS701 family transposase [Thiocapsa rosea]|uniref:IS701 family transposase n=1 Tax=Thiocapsa rosea TaxID=69360 RepID=UPI001FEB9D3C|nr:transposase [Thiocapsa rosea]